MEAVIISTPDGIKAFQMMALKGALKLETKGMTRHGKSAYSIVKETFGFKGSKVSVLAQYEAHLRNIGVLVEV